MEVRANMKKYLDIASAGEAVLIPRKENRNVVIISEEEYRRLSSFDRMGAYAERLCAGRQEAGGGELLSHNLKKLSAIRAFGDNWNGNGAAAFSPALMDRVEIFLRDLVIQPEIFPTALGTIQLEYDNARRDHMEIDLSEEERAELFIVRFNGEESTEFIEADPEAVNDRVRAFYG